MEATQARLSLFMPKCYIVHLRIQRGIEGPDPPGKSQVIVIWVSIEISTWTPPWKKFDPPPPGKCVIKPLDPLCKM